MSEGHKTAPIGWIALVIPVALTLWFATFIPAISAGETIRYAAEWVPHMGVNLSFYFDGLSLMFALLISLIGCFIFLYSGAYLAGHPHIERFFVYLTLFMLSMLGLVLADNLITLFVFWELTTLTSYLLIGFEHADKQARRNALQALLVTAAGGLAMLAGFVLIGLTFGTMELSELNQMGDEIRGHSSYLGILILILLGAFTKSAQVPFHFWLPNAMAAPTPVSAFLHSATMVKGGVYLLARVYPSLGGTEVWMWTLTLFGGATAVIASIIALRQTDMKLMLAYTTVMALGTLTLFLGSNSEIAVAGAVAFILVHSLYKAGLFMMVGTIDHEAGTRELDKVGGLGKLMPVTMVAAALACLSMAGIPPFIGFIGKEMLYEGALATPGTGWLVVIFALAANAMMVTVAALIALKPFRGPLGDMPKKPHEGPMRMWLGPITLASLGLVFGVLPFLAEPMMQAGASAVMGQSVDVGVYLWHGFNLPLLLSVVTLALGILLYARYDRVKAALVRFEQRMPTNADDSYDSFMDGLARFSIYQTRIFQSGTLRVYLQWVFAVVTLALGATMVFRGGGALPTAFPDMALFEWVVSGLLVAGAILTVVTRSRLVAICALGVVGTSIALIFAMYGAPDVAITQLMIDILVVVLVALIVPRLPGFTGVNHPGQGGRLRDGILAVGAGSVVAMITLAASDGPLDRSITDFYEAFAYVEAFGRNIVNVILVDFRALDTFGEIVVVGVAGIACYIILKLRLSDRRE